MTKRREYALYRLIAKYAGLKRPLSWKVYNTPVEMTFIEDDYILYSIRALAAEGLLK